MKYTRVLRSLIRPLLQRNYHVLRFNSRGVGRSNGWSSFTGTSESSDLQDVTQWGIDNVSAIGSVVIIVRGIFISGGQLENLIFTQGYSHGSLIASRQPLLAPPIKTSHILLSYPLSTRGPLTLFRASTYVSSLDELIQNPYSNVFVIYGDQDEFTSARKYDDWAKNLRSLAAGEGKGQIKVVRIAEATHFWNGDKEAELIRAVSAWLP